MNPTTPIPMPHRSADKRSAPEPSGEPAVIDSARLLAGRNEIRIRHEGQVYRLRVTKNGKLILNK